MILNEMLKNYRLILASQSPRRNMLLKGLDLDFEVIVRENIDESYPDELEMLRIPEFLAKSKAAHYHDLLTKHTILITADTIVWLNNHFVGKPENEEDARNIIRNLSGNVHTVVTGVCLSTAGKQRVFHSVSEVHFHKLADEEIDYYVEKYKPFDKAGAYGIQEWIGYIGIERIEGSFYNVMGLPVQQVYCELRQFIS